MSDQQQVDSVLAFVGSDFSRSQCERALSKASGSIDEAIALLLDGSTQRVIASSVHTVHACSTLCSQRSQLTRPERKQVWLPLLGFWLMFVACSPQEQEGSQRQAAVSPESCGPCTRRSCIRSR